MKRQFIAMLVGLPLLLAAVVLPEFSINARKFSFEQDGNQWIVTVTMCTNGFKVDATGGTTAGTTTEIRVEQVNRLLPNDKPPFVQQTEPVAYTSGNGSNLVASASTSQIQIMGTGSFYFQEEQSPGTSIQTVVTGYVNGTPFTIAQGSGADAVADCLIPPSLPQANEGAYDPADAINRESGQDGRASFRPGDKVVIYCVSTGPSAGGIIVDGIDVNSSGYRLGEFDLNDVNRVSPKGISQPAVDGSSTITLWKAYGAYHLEWDNGPWSSQLVKVFTCAFNKKLYNKTTDQLKSGSALGSDGRVDPKPGDKMAVYCNTMGKNAGTIVVLGINSMSQGFPLATFKYTDIVKASPNPIPIDTQQYGTVTLRVDNDDNFYLEWGSGSGNPYDAKGFQCRF